jgi:rubredoxin
MSEMHTISCPSCETANQPQAAVDGIQEYRCHSCGLVYYGPCGCDTTDSSAAKAQATSETAAMRRLSGACTVVCAGDWETATPPVETRDRAAISAHPGC